MKLWNGINTLLLLLLGGYLLFSEVGGDKPEIVFADVETLYQGFDHKKEVDQELKGILKERQRKLKDARERVKGLRDSLKTLGNNAPKELQERFQKSRRSLGKLQERFRSSEGKIRERFREKVWKKLERYIRSFAEKNGYRLVLGASQQKSVLYGEGDREVTEKLLDHVNQRFAEE